MGHHVICLAITLVIVGNAQSQELQEWKSKSGHTTRAAFSSLDEDAGTVTLLIPRTIKLDDLSPESIAAAKAIAADQEAATESPPEAQEADEPISQPPSKHELGIEFIRNRYYELLAFKRTPQFAEFGFAIGGPYHAWLDAVQTAHNSRAFGTRETAIAIGNLLQLGMEYLESKGEETHFSRTAQHQIEEILAGRDPAPDRTKLTNPQRGTFKYVDDDVYPAVFGFTTLDGLREFWKAPEAEPTTLEMRRFGIVPIPVETKVQLISAHPVGGVTVFRVVPVESDVAGTRLYVVEMDLFDEP